MSTGRRIYVGGLAHETHTFSAVSTPLSAFQSYEWAEGDELIAAYRGTRTSLGGIIDGATAADLWLIPGFYTFAIPSGLVPAADFSELTERALAPLRQRLPVDGVILVLHGAMVAEGTGDTEGALLAQVRQVVGPDIPVIATLDLHANISAQMASAADLLIGYDTYPHVDVYDRGVEAAHLMRRLLDDASKPVTAYASVPILAVPQRQITTESPMRDLFDRVHEIEEDPAVLAVTLAGGFCYSDVECAGMVITVTTNGDPERARTYAAELQQAAWSAREDFIARNLPPAEAVARVAAMPPGNGPAILVDVADNIGGGAPGDGTVLLAEVLRHGLREVAIVIADPEAVDAAFGAGVGGDFAGPVGGKTDRFHGEPVPVEGRVRLLSDGRFIYRGSYMTGQERHMGRTAVLDVAGNYLVLTERKTMPFDSQQLRSVGITPEHCRAIVVKSATAWRAAYEAMAGLVLDVDTPGICTVALDTLPYTQLTRPIYPLDPAETITLPEVVVTHRGEPFGLNQ